MKGWYGNRQMHSLVSKGIKSKQYRAFGEDYENINKPYDEQIFNKAKEHFGITDNPEKVGFILPDGSMLDFSNKKEDFHRRWYDHARIIDVGASQREFVEMGAVRIGITPSGQAFDFQLYEPLTNSQKRMISKIIKEYQPHIFVDISGDYIWNEEMEKYIGSPKSLEFDTGTYSSTVFRKIDEVMA